MKYIRPYVVVLASIFLVSPLLAQESLPPVCTNGTNDISEWKFSANTLYQLTGSTSDLGSQMQFSHDSSVTGTTYFALSADASASRNNKIGIDGNPAIIWNDSWIASDGAACLYLGSSATFSVYTFLGTSGGGQGIWTCQSEAAGIITMQAVSRREGSQFPTANGIKVNIQAVPGEADICEFIADGNCNMFGTTPPPNCVAYFSTICGDQAHCGGNKECCVFEWKSTLAERLGITASSYSWDFGDGNTSTDSNPTHTYKKPTQHQVTLKIKDSKDNSYTSTETMFTEN